MRNRNEKIAGSLFSCSCRLSDDEYVQKRNHFIDISHPAGASGQKFHSICVEILDEGGNVRVDNCHYKNETTLRRIISSPGVVPVENISQQGASILLENFCCPPDCLYKKLSDESIEERNGTKYLYKPDDKKYFEENGVVCPVCGSIPEKYEGGEFYHNYCEEGMYSCSIKSIFKQYIVNPEPMIKPKERRITEWEKASNNSSRWTKKRNTMNPENNINFGELVYKNSTEVNNIIRNKESKISELESDKKKLKKELQSKKDEVSELQKEKENLANRIKKIKEKFNPYKKSNTNKASKEEKLKDSEVISKIGDLQSEVYGESYVYVIEILKDGEKYYYVGKSNDPSQRIKTHIRYKKVVGVERVEGCVSEEAALDRERELSYELAIEKQTTNILGGH